MARACPSWAWAGTSPASSSGFGELGKRIALAHALSRGDREAQQVAADFGGDLDLGRLDDTEWPLRGHPRPEDQECQNASCGGEDSYDGDRVGSLVGARRHRQLQSPPVDATLPPRARNRPQ
jgi:hypothetical protein